jgi:hypothetical protein
LKKRNGIPLRQNLKTNRKNNPVEKTEIIEQPQCSNENVQDQRQRPNANNEETEGEKSNSGFNR